MYFLSQADYNRMLMVIKNFEPLAQIRPIESNMFLKYQNSNYLTSQESTVAIKSYL